LLNCAVAADVARPEVTVLDLGSGAGLPGLVWALIRPDLVLTLVEPLQRRAGFLVEVVAELGLGSRVQVLRGRAEELAGSITADVVTSRAVAPLSRLAGWSLPLVAPAGIVAALKGASAAEELDRSADDLRRAGAGPAEVLIFGADVLEQPTRVVVIRRHDEGNEGTV
jgi:16S rRNA (guanine527-N7)-methyltransferase